MFCGLLVFFLTDFGFDLARTRLLYLLDMICFFTILKRL